MVCVIKNKKEVNPLESRISNSASAREKYNRNMTVEEEAGRDPEAFMIMSEEPERKKKHRPSRKELAEIYEKKKRAKREKELESQIAIDSGKVDIRKMKNNCPPEGIEIPAKNEEAHATVEEIEEELVISVDEIIAESERRMDKLRLVGVDQITGEGIPDHTELVIIPDYPIEKQYLTKEVAGTKIYREVTALGSIEAYVEHFNTARASELNGNGISVDDAIEALYLTRLRRDPSFAFKKCFYIQDKTSGRNIAFTLNYPQIALLARLERMRRQGKPIRLILLKARQWGGSTLVQLYMAWIQIFVIEGWNSVIIAQTKDTARRIKGMYSRMLKHFPSDVVFGIPQLRFSPKENSTADSTITDESGVVVRDNVVTIASFENFESTRGANFAMAHFSEVAYWVNTPGKTAEALITNIAGGMLMAPLTLEVMESTANGMSGYFYDEYQIAKDPHKKSSRESLFIPFFMILNDTKAFRDANEKLRFAKWLIDNRYDETDSVTTESGQYLWSLWLKGAPLEAVNWYIEQRARFHDHASIASEAPSDDVECFKHSGRTIFDQYLVDHYRKLFVRDPIYYGEIMQPEGSAARLAPYDEKGGLWVWQMPDNSPTNDRYLVVVDVGGRSTKADFSVITVVDRWPLRFGGKAEVVARWRGHIRYDFLAVKAVMIARLYCNALLVFESNTFDKKKAESTEFVERGDHTRGILSAIEDEYDNLYMRASTSPEDIRQGRFKKIGFQTNVKTKQDMVDHFIVSFEDNTRFLEPDYRAYEEMSIYEQREDGSYGNIAGKNNHDDILMTDMIADLISDQLPIPSPARPSVYASWNLGTNNESNI